MTGVLEGLVANLPGAVFTPGDDWYGAATTPDNASFPQQPCAVVRARSADDVARTVAVVARFGGRVVVQATGHGAGAPVGPDQVLLDTSALDGVIIDAAARTARVGTGSMWPAVHAAAVPHRLLGLSGTSPTVGVAGYTFAGGVGWFVRKHGLAAAALRSVEYVDGTGRLRHAIDEAPEAVDREAIWAFRGGAPVGIATSLDVGLVPVPDLWTGYLLWPAKELPAVAAAWVAATSVVSDSVTSSLSSLRLPSDGPFPEEMRGTAVVHLSYASPDGGAHLDPMRDLVRAAAQPTMDTTGPGDLDSLARIHLDPPAAVPARGDGRWLGVAATDVLVSMFDAARIGQPDGLNMIELRHTNSRSTGVDGAMTATPGPFLLHAVGSAPDDAARSRVDHVLRAVRVAGRSADIGRAAPSFREGQPDAGDAMSTADVDRLLAVRQTLDPGRVLSFARHPASWPSSR
jgi:FAD/FMN-containing dehydrogenase